MAAGHGKRLRSSRSKMLHTVWGVPTVVGVSGAATRGLSSPDQVVVVGTEAEEVIRCLGKAEGRRFVLQEEQRGTGDAVRAALGELSRKDLKRDIYVFPADKGLLDDETVRLLRDRFVESRAQMMVMTGMFSGDPCDNSHGRIVRVPERDAEDRMSPPSDVGNIIEIRELADVSAMGPDEVHKVRYRGRNYDFRREKLLNEREFNAGVYAFNGEPLARHVHELNDDNAQGELYLTDLILLFSDSGFAVEAEAAPREEVVLGFDDKEALRRMDTLARGRAYEKLKKLVTLGDKENFFIANEVVEQILEMDRNGLYPDIYVGEGAHIGAGVRVSPGVHIEKNARLLGRIHLGRGVFIGESAYLDTFEHQTMVIGDGSEILQRNILKGNVRIGSGCRIETTVRLTGSHERPMIVGNNVRIKGTTYMFGCIVEDGTFIQNCYLFEKKIRFKNDDEGKPVKVCHVSAEPRGTECVGDLTDP